MRILLALTLTLCLCTSQNVKADHSCVLDASGAQLCTAQISLTGGTNAKFDSQYQSQWCWAAAVSAVFNYHKHPVKQERIVQEVYGGIVNLPAFSGVVIANQLNKNWLDDNGKSFSARLTGAYDVDANVNAITNSMIVAELTNNKPLVIGNRSHAMVLTSVSYYPNFPSFGIVKAQVFDPWPGIGYRSLRQSEMQPAHLGGELRFLASANVTTLSGNNDQTTPPSNPGQSMDAAAGSWSIYALFVALLFVMSRKLTA